MGAAVDQEEFSFALSKRDLLICHLARTERSLASLRFRLFEVGKLGMCMLGHGGTGTTE